MAGGSWVGRYQVRERHTWETEGSIFERQSVSGTLFACCCRSTYISMTDVFMFASTERWDLVKLKLRDRREQ